MLKSFYQANREKLQKFNGLLMTNPIMERGIILAPIIVASYNTQNSVALGIGFSIITFITVMLSSFIPRRIPYTVRTILYSLLACVVFVPTAMLIERLLPGSLYSLGVFLPLLVANSLIVVKSESRFHRNGFGYMTVDVACHAAGFFIAIVLVGLIREVLGSGTVFGVTVNPFFTASAVLMPFSGFIIIGLLAAVSKRIRTYLEEPASGKKKRRGGHE